LRVRVREGNRELSAGVNREGKARAKEVPSKDEDKLRGLGERLEELKVLADINDPVVKKRFEDGFGKSLPSSSSSLHDQECFPQRNTQLTDIVLYAQAT